MPIELRILGGARAGYSESFDKSVIAIGRHPMSDLRFDVTQDLDVSTRHGEIRCVAGRYTVHDSNSTNGTFVNGQRVSPGESLELHDRDVIAFGAHGPKVSVRLGATLASRATTGTPAPPAPPAPPVRMAADAAILATSPSGTAPSSAKARRNTAERVAMAVREQTRALRIAVLGAVLLLGGLAAAIYMKSNRAAEEARSEIQKLLSENDSIAKTVQAQIRGDTLLVNSLRRHNDSLVRAVKDAKGAAQAAQARAALQRSQDVQRQFSAMDFTAIRDANDPAVVLIASEIGDAAPLEATGFAVRPSGLIVTNRHVVVDSEAHATKISVKFANTGRWYHAHVVKMPDNSSVDLALLQIDEPGKFPIVAKLANEIDTPVGGPVATIGYPLGTDLPMDGSAAKTSLTIGNVSKSVPELLQIDAFASHGSSGSPVFDVHGHVIGVVWGGPPGAAGRIVFSVPVDRLNELLRGVK